MDNRGNPTREPTNQELYQQPPHSPAAHPAANLPAPNPHVPMPSAQLEHAAARPTVDPGLKMQLALAIVSLALAVPLSALASTYGGVIGLVVAWIGILGVNGIFYSAWKPRGKN